MFRMCICIIIVVLVSSCVIGNSWSTRSTKANLENFFHDKILPYQADNKKIEQVNLLKDCLSKCVNIHNNTKTLDLLNNPDVIDEIIKNDITVAYKYTYIISSSEVTLHKATYLSVNFSLYDKSGYWHYVVNGEIVDQNDFNENNVVYLQKNIPMKVKNSSYSKETQGQT